MATLVAPSNNVPLMTPASKKLRSRRVHMRVREDVSHQWHQAKHGSRTNPETMSRSLPRVELLQSERARARRWRR